MTERSTESWGCDEFCGWDCEGEVRLGNKFGSFAVSRGEESGKEFWDLGRIVSQNCCRWRQETSRAIVSWILPPSITFHTLAAQGTSCIVNKDCPEALSWSKERMKRLRNQELGHLTPH